MAGKTIIDIWPWISLKKQELDNDIYFNGYLTYLEILPGERFL